MKTYKFQTTFGPIRIVAESFEEAVKTFRTFGFTINKVEYVSYGG